MDSMELTHGKNDPFLNEETDFGTSAVAPHRVRPDHFKGFNKAQNMYIYSKWITPQYLYSDSRLM